MPVYQSTDDQNDLISRLNLIEQTIQDGRRTTVTNGWMFLLWGVGYLVAIGWVYYLPKPMLAWPVIMTLTAVVGWIVGTSKRRGQPETIKSRAIGAVWTATATTIFLFAFGSAASINGWSHPQTMLAGIELVIGLAHMASALTLRWKAQGAIAIVWWVCGILSFYVGESYLLPVLLIASLIGNFGFGIYLMVQESKARSANGPLASQVAHG